MTVAIYASTQYGFLRCGLFRFRSKYSPSARAIGEQFLRQHPHFDADTLYIAPRHKLMGRWVDGQRLKYQ